MKWCETIGWELGAGEGAVAPGGCWGGADQRFVVRAFFRTGGPGKGGINKDPGSPGKMGRDVRTVGRRVKVVCIDAVGMKRTAGRSGSQKPRWWGTFPKPGSHLPTL